MNQLQKEFEELKTFVGVFYGKYLSMETEMKEVKKTLFEMKHQNHLQFVSELNESNNLNNVNEMKEVKELTENQLQQLHSSPTQLLNNLSNTLQLPIENEMKSEKKEIKEDNNQIILSKQIENEKEIIQSNMIYFLDSLYYEGLSEHLLLKLFEWMESNSFSLLFDSKTSSTLPLSFKSSIQPISSNSNKKLMIIFFTSSNEIFGFTHSKCLSETDNYYFTSTDSFMFSISHHVNEIQQPIKIIKKYDIHSSITELSSVVYSIPYCLTVKFNSENGKYIGKFNSNFQTYYKLDRDSIDTEVNSHQITLSHIVSSSHSFEMKRCIIFDY